MNGLMEDFDSFRALAGARAEALLRVIEVPWKEAEPINVPAKMLHNPPRPAAAALLPHLLLWLQSEVVSLQQPRLLWSTLRDIIFCLPGLIVVG